MSAPCMCGATDCPSCGPAQGYEVVKVWVRNRYVFVNPEHDPIDDFEPEPTNDLEEA